MAYDGNGKAVNVEEEKVKLIHGRSVMKVSEQYELAKKGWEESKAQLRGVHSSVRESILAGRGGGESETQIGITESDRVNVENTSMWNDQDVIEEIEGLDGYDDNEIDDIEEVIVGEEDARGTAIGIEKGKQPWPGLEEASSDEGDVSDDVSYLGGSSSYDTDESVFDEFDVENVSVDNGDDEEEDEVGHQYVDGPPEELTALDKAEAAATRPHFMVGMTFMDKRQLKRAIDKYAIRRGVNLKILRSDKKCMQVVCEEGCPFLLYASTYGVSVRFQVKTLFYEHMCARVYKNPRASTMWLAEHFREKVQEAPQFKTSEMKNEV